MEHVMVYGTLAACILEDTITFAVAWAAAHGGKFLALSVIDGTI